MKLWLPILVLYVLATALSVFITREANLTSAASYTLNQRLVLKENTKIKLKTFFGRASFGLYKGGARESAELEEIIKAYSTHRRNAVLASWGLVGLAVTLLSLGYLQSSRGLQNIISQHLLFISLPFLFIGLLTPIFSLVVSQNVPILQQIVLKQDSKGILDTIETLFGAKQIFVALLLLTFSVVTPVIKTVLTFLVLNGRDKTGALAKIVKIVGKWSMADVFVVALLLAIFSLGSDGLTDARLGIGLYFFAGYVLLSLLATQLIGLPKPNLSSE